MDVQVPEQARALVNPTTNQPIFPPHVKHDPRIPTPSDPPNGVFRTQLICTLLQTTGSYFVTGKSRDRLDEFLTYFQRYLFSKAYLPPEIEFMVMDLLDYLDEEIKVAGKEEKKKKKEKGGAGEGLGLARFDSWEECHAVISRRELEAYEKSRAAGNKDEQTVADEDDEDDDDDEEDEADGKDGDDDDDDDGAAEEEDGEDGRGVEDQGDDDDVAEVHRAAAAKTEEDLEFEKEFEKVSQ